MNTGAGRWAAARYICLLSIKTRDSLAADINGTYEGPDGDRTTAADKYADYIEYTLDSEGKTDIAYYDADDNTVDEGNGTGLGNGGTEGTNYTAAEESHSVKQTQEGMVLTMEEWKAMGSPVGKYWVYDTDGWAYWAEAIEPGEATGLLLDGIEAGHGAGGEMVLCHRRSRAVCLQRRLGQRGR
ncbi:MAG: hypothetical protein ACLR23_05470 [Clostridia bacterium]